MLCLFKYPLIFIVGERIFSKFVKSSIYLHSNSKFLLILENIGYALDHIVIYCYGEYVPFIDTIVNCLK